MIRWKKKRANKFPRRTCDVFVSDWLENLIHIHSRFRRVLHILDCSLMRVDVSSGGGLILLMKEEDA